MPGRDKTGPQGLGSKTGRRTGLCVGDTMTEWPAMGSGRGSGRRRRRGGFGNGQKGRGGGMRRRNRLHTEGDRPA